MTRQQLLNSLRDKRDGDMPYSDEEQALFELLDVCYRHMRDNHHIRSKAIKPIMNEYKKREIDRQHRSQIYIDIKHALDFFNSEYPYSKMVAVARYADNIEYEIAQANYIIERFQDDKKRAQFPWITEKVYAISVKRKWKALEEQSELIKHLPVQEDDVENKRSIEAIIIPSKHSQEVIKALESGENFDFGKIEEVDWEEIESYAEETD